MPREDDLTVKDTRVADALTKHLIEPRERRYGGVDESILLTRVKAEISGIADRLVTEVIAANPDLHTVIYKKVQETIARALRDDTYLNEVVVEAVAKGLGTLVSQRNGDEREDDD